MEIMIQNSEAYNGATKYRKFKWHVLLLLDSSITVK